MGRRIFYLLLIFSNDKINKQASEREESRIKMREKRSNSDDDDDDEAVVSTKDGFANDIVAFIWSP